MGPAIGTQYHTQSCARIHPRALLPLLDPELLDSPRKFLSSSSVSALAGMEPALGKQLINAASVAFLRLTWTVFLKLLLPVPHAAPNIPPKLQNHLGLF